MIIDAHIHLYDPTRPQGVPYPKPDNHLIYRPMLPADLRDVAEPVGVRGAVFVECSPWVEDNQWVLDLVADEPFVCAVVGNLDPESPDYPSLLERFVRNPLFRGIRIRTGRSPGFAKPRVRENLAKLAAAGGTLDVLVRGEEIDALAQLASALPGLRIMIDHLAHVPVRGGPPDPDWSRRMEAFVGLTNVFCKVSLFTELAGEKPAPLALDYYEPTFDAVWRIFGADRLAFGSNWPPCLNAGDYCATVTLARDFFLQKGSSVVAKVMGRNAAAFYGGPRFAALLRLPN